MPLILSWAADASRTAGCVKGKRLFACSVEASLLTGGSVTGELYFGSDFSRNSFYPPTGLSFPS
jgi:hypothetical protein